MTISVLDFANAKADVEALRGAVALIGDWMPGPVPSEGERRLSAMADRLERSMASPVGAPDETPSETPFTDDKPITIECRLEDEEREAEGCGDFLHASRCRDAISALRGHPIPAADSVSGGTVPDVTPSADGIDVEALHIALMPWSESVLFAWREYWRGRDHRYGGDFAAFLGERLVTDFALRSAYPTTEELRRSPQYLLSALRDRFAVLATKAEEERVELERLRSRVEFLESQTPDEDDPFMLGIVSGEAIVEAQRKERAEGIERGRHAGAKIVSIVNEAFALARGKFSDAYEMATEELWATIEAAKSHPAVLEILHSSESFPSRLIDTETTAKIVQAGRDNVHSRRARPTIHKAATTPVRAEIGNATENSTVSTVRSGAQLLMIQAAWEFEAANVPGYRRVVAMRAGLNADGGTWKKYYPMLRAEWFLNENESGSITTTAKGLGQLGQIPAIRPAVLILDLWRPKLGGGPMRIVDLLSKQTAWARKTDLADAVGMTTTGGPWKKYFPLVRKSLLIEVSDDGQQVRMHPALFLKPRGGR